MSASEPPELPEEPEVEYRRPAWVEPPADLVLGIVPVEFLLATAGTHAVLITDPRAYPTGWEFALTARRRPDQLGPRRHHDDWDLRRLAYRDLWLELRFADGQTASNYPGQRHLTFETEQPDPSSLYCGGGGGGEGGWRSHHWLWGLPPPEALAFVCAWPAGQRAAVGVEVDASLDLEAAGRAEAVWPTSGRP